MRRNSWGEIDGNVAVGRVSLEIALALALDLDALHRAVRDGCLRRDAWGLCKEE